MATAGQRIVPNGISGVTGEYDLAPMTVQELLRTIKGEAPEAAPPAHIVARGQKLRSKSFSRSFLDGEPDDLTRAGWGIVFHQDESPAVRQALRPLIDRRRRQVGDDTRVKELIYHPGESSVAWLTRHGVSWFNIKPYLVPSYLLWVGSPEKMPFDVLHELDSDYYLGRLDFETPEEYAAYATSIVAYESDTAGVRNTREMVYFAPRHLFDEATQLSADWLVTPLADGTPASGNTPAEVAIAPHFGFRQRKFVGPDASRNNLLSLLDGPHAPPSLLFTASHGMTWPNGDARQFSAQGALLCQDWPGFGSVAPSHFVAAADVPDSAQVHGMIAFHFACFGGGTPADDLYDFKQGVAPPHIAPKPFTAALPRRLLAHPNGGALACIAHVERAWGCSITGIAATPQIMQFQRAIAQLLLGKPAGLAVQEFNDMSAKLSEVVSGLQGRVYQGGAIDELALVTAWMQRNDAAGFVLLGDPAVRLRAAELV